MNASGSVRQRRGWAAGALAVVLGTAAVVAPQPESAFAVGETVNVWVTTSDLSQRLTQQAPTAFAAGSGTAPVTISLNEGRTYQTMVGFGATFTDSSAWLLHEKTSTSTRAAVMQDLFSRSGAAGIGLNYLRQPASATDYIKDVGGFYTYDDLPSGQSDPSLSQFSITHDLDYIIPVLSEALQVNPAIKVQLNAWTAPAWMKTNNSLVNGGSLLPQYESTWAAYVIKMIQAYEAEGIPIWATSVANEPTVVRTYPTMTVAASTSATIIRDYLSPGLAAAGLSARVLAGDDVAFDTGYPSSVIDSDPAVSAELPATSIHGYWGDPVALTQLHGFYPNKDVYQTELSPGCSYSPIQLIINTTRNWAQTAVTWNVALDNNNGPYYSTDPNTCKPLVRVDQATGQVTYTDAFYQEGQVSKFVLPGAVRIDSNDNASVRNVAFKNPDGSKVLVAWNATSTSRTFAVNWGNESFTYTLPAGAVGTFTWAGTPTGDAAGWGDSTFGTNAANAYGGGLRTGQWSVIDRASLDQNALGGGGWPSIFFGYADHSDLTVSADVRGVAAGTTAPWPKYGVYACYRDEGNYVQAWIDPTSGNYVTHAVAGGSELGWVNNALPAGFDPGILHNVAVQRRGDVFSFSLDGVQQQTRSAAVGSACQMGLVTEDYRAEFRNVSIVDPLRWGGSQVGADAGNIWAGGVRRGDWGVAGTDSASITSLGTGRSSLFRGYLQGDQTVSAQAQAVAAGTTSQFPKYGVYAAYRDGSNYVQGWIDPTSDNYVTHAVAGGADLGWVNNPLPAGFDASAYHTISVTRSGNTFTFYLDGAQQQTRTAAVGVGQFGLVSEDYRANFRQIGITSDPPAPGLSSGTWYHLYNALSLRQLSVLNGGSANSDPTMIYDPVGENDQLWRLEATASGYQLINQRSGKALSVLGGGTANETSTIIFDNIAAPDQYWAFNAPNDAGYYQLTNQLSGRALSVYRRGTTNETNTIIYDDIDAPDQFWVLAPAH